MKRTAAISHCNRYRYDLTRIWNEGEHLVAFIGLNPSTADASIDDRTILKCIAYAKSWGFGGLVMLNAYSFRATDPRELKKAGYPIGPRNDSYILKWINDPKVTKIIACWSNHIQAGRAADLRNIGELHCLQLNTTGQPAHPLYLSGDLKPNRLI